MDAIDSIFQQAAEMLNTNGVGSIGINCNVCTRQAEFLEGNLKIFLERWYNAKCKCDHGFLTKLVANDSEDDI